MHRLAEYTGNLDSTTGSLSLEVWCLGRGLHWL